MQENTAHTKRNIGVIVEVDDPAERAGIAIENWLEHAPHAPVLFLVSGGSSFEVLEHISPEMLGSHVTVGMIDERASTDPEVNNFAQLQKTRFAESAREAGVTFLDSMLREDESLGMLGARIDAAVREWRAHNSDGLVIALLGMGGDGHTAGMMPFAKEEAEQFGNLFESDAWVVGYDAEKKNEHPLRVTVTSTFLRTEVDQALLYVTGEAKREALYQALDMHGERFEIPARVIHDMRNVTIVTNIPVEEAGDVSLLTSNE